MPRSPIERTPLTIRQARLVEENMGLVYHMAGRWLASVSVRKCVRESVRDELVSQGSLALIRAAMGFDPDRGAKFSTYACRAIWVEFVHNAGTFSRRAAAQDRYALRAGEVNRGWLCGRVKGDAWIEVMGESGEDQFNAVETDGLWAEAESVVGDRMWRVLRGRMEEDLTLEAVGNRLGLTKQRVRQLELEAVGLLRRRYVGGIEHRHWEKDGWGWTLWMGEKAIAEVRRDHRLGPCVYQIDWPIDRVVCGRCEKVAGAKASVEAFIEQVIAFQKTTPGHGAGDL